MNISTATASRVAVTLNVTGATSTQDVLAQVNAALRQRAQILEHSERAELQSLATNMWEIRAEIVQFLSGCVI